MTSQSSRRVSLGNRGQHTTSSTSSRRQQDFSSSPVVLSPLHSSPGTHDRGLPDRSVSIDMDDDPDNDLDDDRDDDESDHLDDLEAHSQEERRLAHEMLLHHLATLRPLKRDARAKAVAYDRKLRILGHAIGYAETQGSEGMDVQLSHLQSEFSAAMVALELREAEFEELSAQFVQASGASSEAWHWRRAGPLPGVAHIAVAGPAPIFAVVPREQDLLPNSFQELNRERELLRQEQQELTDLQALSDSYVSADAETPMHLMMDILSSSLRISDHTNRIHELENDISIFGPQHHFLNDLPAWDGSVENGSEDDNKGPNDGDDDDDDDEVDDSNHE